MKDLQDKILKAISEGILNALEFTLDDFADSDNDYILKQKLDLTLLSQDYIEKSQKRFDILAEKWLDNSLNEKEQDEFNLLKAFCTFKVSTIQLVYHAILYNNFVFPKFIDASEITNTALLFKLKTDDIMKLLDLSNFDTSNVTNMSETFCVCDQLELIDGLDNFDTHNVTDMSWMFRCCYKLTLVDLSSFDTSKVIFMQNMFSYCESLTYLDLSNFDVKHVNNMSNMFGWCYGLTQLDLSNFNTCSVVDMSRMFIGCSNLKYLDLSHFNTSNLNNACGLFSQCTKLTCVDLSNFNLAGMTNHFLRRMFSDCESLTLVIMKNCSDDTVQKISYEIPKNCEIIR